MLKFIYVAVFLFPFGAHAGQFKGDVVTRWLQDGVLMELTEDFSYTDDDGLEWRVPKGIKVDGASIPAEAWYLIGNPLQGKYRNASVIHDMYCDLRTRHYKETHLVFYNAMIDSGVDRYMANIMYYAVLRFGPHWEDSVSDNIRECLESGRCLASVDRPEDQVFTPTFDKSDFDEFVKRVEQEEIKNPADIAKLADEKLQAKEGDWELILELRRHGGSMQ